MPLPTSGKGLELLIIQICCGIVVYVSVCLRLWAQHINRKRPSLHNNITTRRVSLHDVLMHVSVFFYTIQAVIVIRGIIEGGIGQHANDIDQTEITIGFQTWYFGELIYPVLSCLTKTSVILFLQQAYIVKFQTREATNRRYIQWVLYICLCAIWTSSNVFLSASIFQCSPPSHYWMQFEDPSSEGTCSKSIVPAAGIVLSIVTAASDWALASVPIVALTKTQIPWRKKAAIQALSSLGVVRTSPVGSPFPMQSSYRAHAERGPRLSKNLPSGEIYVKRSFSLSSNIASDTSAALEVIGHMACKHHQNHLLHTMVPEMVMMKDASLPVFIVCWSRQLLLCVATVNHLGMLLAGNTDTNMAANKVVTDNRWMTISEQYDNLSIQLTPLLAERLDVMQATAGMALLVGLPSSTELAQHLGATSSAGDVLLDADPRAKVLRIACPTLPRRVSAEGHCRGDNIEWARGSGLKHSESLATIYSRLLGPFSHVVCVFVSSFSSTLELGSFLSSWLRSTWSRTQMFAPSHSPAALPRLIVLTEGKTLPGSGFLGGLKSSLEAIVMEQTGFSLTRAFSNFTVKETLTEVGLLRQRRYTKMTAFLESECAAARRDFERLNMLYDAHNLVDLFSRAYRCLLSNTIFNPVIASRAWNPIPSNAVRQIVRFLSDYEDKESLQKFALPYLVSAIRANAYPATSHPFDFPLIFDTIYKSTWDHAAHTVSLTEDMCLLFERMVRRSLDAVAVVDTEDTTNLMKNAKSMNGLNAANLLDTVTTVGPNPDDCVTQAKTDKVTAGQLNEEDHAAPMDIHMSSHERRHLCYLVTIRDRWRSHKVQDYCPACILRRPEYGLPCGHMYCEHDMRLLGRKIGRETYAVDECICCQARFTGVIFRFRPKTRGIRILALDGGGVRGIMILKCLQLLQTRLRDFLPGMDIIEMFDVCAGTSTGKFTKTLYLRIAVEIYQEAGRRDSEWAMKGCFRVALRL
ncbi:hypothetical protein IWW34DRAFT_642344 [Fusarium oxysporum f. sp. albedinis]|nr:hypothetical protein IWW34DRAFT_642344 [Fusarium oxysporum f. sp. albedinis]